MYDQYNLTFFHMANSQVSNILLRLINSFIEGINKHRIPRMVILVLDDDIITGVINEDKPGTSRSLGTALSWILGKFEDIVAAKKKEMSAIRRGSTTSSEPKFIWIKALQRPKAKTSSQILIQKYNDILEETLFRRKNSYIIGMDDTITEDLLDTKGDLTAQGRVTFWQKVNSLIKSFDKQEVSLRPASVVTESRQCWDRENNSSP